MLLKSDNFTCLRQDRLEQEYRLTAERRRPTFWRDHVTGKTGAEHVFHAGIFPLAPGPGAPVNRCLAIEDYGKCAPEDVAGFDVGIARDITWRHSL